MTGVHLFNLCACGHYATSHSHGGGSCDSCDCTQARESWPCCYPQPDWRAMYLAAVEERDQLMALYEALQEEGLRSVCPGCYAVAEPCLPGCIDEAMRRAAEEERDREDWRDNDDSEDE